MLTVTSKSLKQHRRAVDCTGSSGSNPLHDITNTGLSSFGMQQLGWLYAAAADWECKEQNATLPCSSSLAGPIAASVTKGQYAGQIHKQSINQSINIFHVLGGNWDPTDKKFSSVNSCR